MTRVIKINLNLTWINLDCCLETDCLLYNTRSAGGGRERGWVGNLELLYSTYCRIGILYIWNMMMIMMMCRGEFSIDVFTHIFFFSLVANNKLKENWKIQKQAFRNKCCNFTGNSYHNKRTPR
jgi:hypothetical protein